MPHPRPTGAPDALSAMLRSTTAAVHEEAEQRPFMRAFFAGALPRDAYVGWLARQWHLYRTIEAALDALPARAPESGLVPVELYRTERIEADLDHLTDGAWRGVDHLTEATGAYVARIESTSGFPPGLVAHAWLRYMGNVGGRDVLRRLVVASIGASEDDEDGLSFTTSPPSGTFGPSSPPSTPGSTPCPSTRRTRPEPSTRPTPGSATTSPARTNWLATSTSSRPSAEAAHPPSRPPIPDLDSRDLILIKSVRF